MRLLALLLALSSCDGFYGTFVAEGSEFGSVYECEATSVDTLELCTDLSLEGLEKSTGWDCRPTSRLWPLITGCAYGCFPHQGCNAHHGCYCPE
jgi:hypothetical protein